MKIIGGENEIQKIPTPINDLYIIEPTVFGDNRGFFMESYSKKDFEEIGLNMDFVQDNHSKSKKESLEDFISKQNLLKESL